MENLIFFGALLLLNILLLERRLLVTERRERELWRMIRSLENRISAKDLGGFMALESEDREAKNPREKKISIPRNDEGEALLEQMRLYGGAPE